MEMNKHTWFEDLIALFTGSMCMGFGVYLLKINGMLTGGTAGLSLIFSNVLPFSFGQIFFVINLPFYWLAYTHMGKRFTINTFIAVGTLALTTDLMHLVVQFETVNLYFASVFGGLLLGLGMLILFRHQASLGGVGILGLYLQKNYNIRAGKFLMAVDITITFIGFFLVSLPILAFSVLGAFFMNLVIAVNHKPGRYQGS